MWASEILGSAGVFFTLLLFVLGILIPLMIYTGQKWAYKCYMELKEQTAIQKKMFEIVKAQNGQIGELNLSMREVNLTLKER